MVGCVSGALKVFRLPASASDTGVKPLCEFDRPKAHRGTINVVHVCNGAGSPLGADKTETVVVLTGGKDSIIRAWSVKREVGADDARTSTVIGLELLWTMDVRNVALVASHLPRSACSTGLGRQEPAPSAASMSALRRGRSSSACLGAKFSRSN